VEWSGKLMLTLEKEANTQSPERHEKQTRDPLRDLRVSVVKPPR
jgi:hypothetical protein